MSGKSALYCPVADVRVDHIAHGSDGAAEHLLFYGEGDAHILRLQAEEVEQHIFLSVAEIVICHFTGADSFLPGKHMLNAVQDGAFNDGELIGFITDQLTKGLILLEMKNPEIVFSPFTARTRDGDVLLGWNYDFSKTNAMIVRIEGSDDRRSTISTVDLQFLNVDTEENMEGSWTSSLCWLPPYAPLDGINDAGVSCGIYMTYQGGVVWQKFIESI